MISGTISKMNGGLVYTSYILNSSKLLIKGMIILIN